VGGVGGGQGRRGSDDEAREQEEVHAGHLVKEEQVRHECSNK
jgi:hypothetical protein